MKSKKFRKNSKKQLRSKKQITRSRKQKRTRKLQKGGLISINNLKDLKDKVATTLAQLNKLNQVKEEVFNTLIEIKSGIAGIPSDISTAGNEFIKSLKAELAKSLDPFKQQVEELRKVSLQQQSTVPE